MTKLKTQRRDLRPNFLKRNIVGNTDKQFTTPTSAVISVGLNPVDVKIVLE